jgi:hypothetical protein
MYKISSSCDKAQGFHKTWKFNTQQEFTNDQTAKENIKQIENASKKSTKKS